MITAPTILTVIRIFLAIVFAVFACLPVTWARIVALLVFIVAAVTDHIDGYWARKKKIVTDLGAFLDPLADKILINLAFLILVTLKVIPIWVFATILIRDFAVDGMRMMSAKNGITVAASKLGKVKTTSQMVALIIILANLVFEQESLMVIGNIILYLALGLTILSGADYLIKGWKKAIK